MQHDERVLKGERGPNLFPKPVYEEAPFQQRENIFKAQRVEFHRNLTLLAQAIQTNQPNQQKLMEKMDMPRFKALCRGEELRVSTTFMHKYDPSVCIFIISNIILAILLYFSYFDNHGKL